MLLNFNRISKQSSSLRRGSSSSSSSFFVFSIFFMMIVLFISCIQLVDIFSSCTLSTSNRNDSSNSNSINSLLFSNLLSTTPTTSSQSTITKNQPETLFDSATQFSYQLIHEQQQQQEELASTMTNNNNQKFDIQTWDKKTTGGLQNLDRLKLVQYYSNVSSVFEYGLGESTYIADAVHVSRYSGIDSDATWVSLARQEVSKYYRFYFADIGPTIEWGHPEDINLMKSILHYQLVPLLVEDLPFDIYMVDGRWRIPCMMISFLHASARGGDTTQTIVLLHDCFREQYWDTNTLGKFPKHLDNRPNYKSADHLLDLIDHSYNRLCIYRRKPTTTDEQLYDFWKQHYTMID